MSTRSRSISSTRSRGRRSPGSAIVTELWETRSAPADNRGNVEVTDHPFRLAPPKNGSVLRIIEYPPDKERLAALEAPRASADDGSRHGAAFEVLAKNTLDDGFDASPALVDGEIFLRGYKYLYAIAQP